MTTYQTDAEGKFIPASQRPDGTWRKARRVKDGYVPQEEVPLYESKGKQYAKRQTGIPPGMCPIMAEAARIEREAEERKKAKKLKKEAAAAAALAASGVTDSISNQAKSSNIPGVLVVKNESGAKTSASVANEKPKKSKKHNSASSKPTSSSNKTANTNAPTAVSALTKDLDDKFRLQDADDQDDSQGEPQQDLAKQLKKLRKKIREIDNIQERVKSGELKKPDKDQLEKVKRKKDFLKEIEELEKLIKNSTGTASDDDPARNDLQ